MTIDPQPNLSVALPLLQIPHKSKPYYFHISSRGRSWFPPAGAAQRLQPTHLWRTSSAPNVCRTKNQRSSSVFSDTLIYDEADSVLQLCRLNEDNQRMSPRWRGSSRMRKMVLWLRVFQMKITEHDSLFTLSLSGSYSVCCRLFSPSVWLTMTQPDRQGANMSVTCNMSCFCFAQSVAGGKQTSSTFSSL